MIREKVSWREGVFVAIIWANENEMECRENKKKCNDHDYI